MSPSRRASTNGPCRPVDAISPASPPPACKHDAGSSQDKSHVHLKAGGKVRMRRITSKPHAKGFQAYPHSYTHAGCRELLWALLFTIASDSRNSRGTPPDRFVEPRLTEPTTPPPSFPQKKASHWLSAISSLTISCNFLALMPKCQFGHRPLGHPTQTDGRIQEVIRLMLPANLWVLGPMGKLAVQSVGLQDSVSCCA